MISFGVAEGIACRFTSAIGRYCCKSRKSNNPKNLAKVDLWTSLPLRRFSTPLRRSMIDFRLNDMVPHVAARKTHRRSLEFSFNTPKRLLQQYRHKSAVGGRAEHVRSARVFQTSTCSA